MKIDWQGLDPDVDERKFVQKYYDALSPQRKAEIVLQVVTGIEQRMQIAAPNWLSYADDWEIELLTLILWEDWTYFSDDELANEIWACLLSAGASARQRFKP